MPTIFNYFLCLLQYFRCSCKNVFHRKRIDLFHEPTCLKQKSPWSSNWAKGKTPWCSHPPSVIFAPPLRWVCVYFAPFSRACVPAWVEENQDMSAPRSDMDDSIIDIILIVCYMYSCFFDILWNLNI